MTVCAKCGAAIEQPATGRRRRYCSVGCRRAVEYELRRIQRQLEQLEGELLLVETDGRYVTVRAERRKSLRPQIERLEARMRVLLDDGEIE